VEWSSTRRIVGAFFRSLDGVAQASGRTEDVTTQSIGRVRTCKLDRSRMAEETGWTEEYRHFQA
jgi:hypothetical protein